jgi:hypothetical protein
VVLPRRHPVQYQHVAILPAPTPGGRRLIPELAYGNFSPSCLIRWLECLKCIQ